MITVLEPTVSSRCAAHQCAQNARDREHDAEDAELERAPAEHVAAVDAAEGEDGGEGRRSRSCARCRNSSMLGFEGSERMVSAQLGRGGPAGR